MQWKIGIAIMGLAVFMGASGAFAQMMNGSQQGMMQQGEQQEDNYTAPPENDLPMPYHRDMRGDGMGYGYGMGPGMMDGNGMGPGMMGEYGMGPGMMHGYGGSNMGYDMGLGGYCDAPYCQSPEKMQQFYGDTKEIRKKLHDLRFEYGEKMRDPNTTVGELQQMQKQMYEMQQQLMEKARQQ